MDRMLRDLPNPSYQFTKTVYLPSSRLAVSTALPGWLCPPRTELPSGCRRGMC